jgi:hypothetical protein
VFLDYTFLYHTYVSFITISETFCIDEHSVGSNYHLEKDRSTLARRNDITGVSRVERSHLDTQLEHASNGSLYSDQALNLNLSDRHNFAP